MTVCSASDLRGSCRNWRQNTGCCWNKFTNSNRWNPRIQSNTTEKTGKPGGGQAGQGNQDKDTHQKSKLASTVAHRSLLSSNQFFFLWYEEFVLNSLIFVENPSHCSWTSSINPSRCSECGSAAAAASTHHEVIECGCAAVFQTHHFVDACGAELRSCCIFRNRHLIFFLKRSLCELLLEEPNFLGLWLCRSMFCWFDCCFRLGFQFLQILV